MYERYFDQVRLLLSVLPDIAREDAFALKGGTAINLFYRDMPRLRSVSSESSDLTSMTTVEVGPNRQLHSISSSLSLRSSVFTSTALQ